MSINYNSGENIDSICLVSAVKVMIFAFRIAGSEGGKNCQGEKNRSRIKIVLIRDHLLNYRNSDAICHYTIRRLSQSIEQDLKVLSTSTKQKNFVVVVFL